MAYSKGLIPKERVKDLIEFLKAIGIPVRVSATAWEMHQVQIAGRWWAITCSNKDVVGIPDAMLGLAQKFLRETFNNGPAAITDTQRLDFMLEKHRNIVVHVIGSNFAGDTTYYRVYVEQGIMGDHMFPGMEVQGSINDCITPEIKREAIDLAINESKEQTSEKSN